MYFRNSSLKFSSNLYRATIDSNFVPSRYFLVVYNGTSHKKYIWRYQHENRKTKFPMVREGCSTSALWVQSSMLFFPGKSQMQHPFQRWISLAVWFPWSEFHYTKPAHLCTLFWVNQSLFRIHHQLPGCDFWCRSPTELLVSESQFSILAQECL